MDSILSEMFSGLMEVRQISGVDLNLHPLVPNTEQGRQDKSKLVSIMYSSG